jgi:hypothetical protein
MNDPSASARDDLAFIRGLVSDRGQIQSSTGAALLAGGLCFGTQCLIQGLLFQLPVGFPGRNWGQLIGGTLPTLVFLVLVARISLFDKRNNVGAGDGVASRAFRAAFSAVGISIGVTATVFGYVAITEHNMMIWLFHPIMVCVAQGVGWHMAFAIRRRHWFVAVSVAWFASALILATLLHQLGLFIAALGVALYLLMALPGWALMRSAAHRD